MNAFLLSSIFAFILGLSLCIFTYLKDPNSPIHRLFSLFLLCLCLWIFGDFFYLTPLIQYLSPLTGYKVSHIGATLTPCLYLHFIFHYTRVTKYKILLTLNYSLSILLLITNLFSTQFFKSIAYSTGAYYLEIELGPLYNLFIFQVIINACLGLIFAMKQYKKNNGLFKEQMKYVLVGHLFIVIAVTFFFFALKINPSIRLDNLIVILYASFIAYSFTKKQLLNISIIISRTMSTLVTIILYSSIFISISSLYIFYIDTKITIQFIALLLPLIIIACYSFEKIKIHIITTSQKLLLKGHYNHQKTILNLSNDLVNATTLSQIADTIYKCFYQDIEISQSNLYLAENCIEKSDISSTFSFQKHKRKYKTLQNTTLPKTIGPSNPLLAITSKNSKIINKRHQTNPELLDLMQIYNTEIIIPCYTSKSDLIGIIFIGKKMSQSSYTENDCHVFNILSQQIPLAIDRIKKSQLSSELRIAQRIQTEILPKTPTLDNLELTCFMQSADDVGGDYYDIYSIKNKSWIIVGDVAGHGIGSGLIMFMVQSIISTLLHTKPNITPATLNKEANRILWQNFNRLEEGRPMTIISLCTEDGQNFKINGSHDNIFIYRHASKSIETIEINHFPFGIGLMETLQENNKNNTHFKLNQQDLLFLGTDGIVEAFKNGNPKKEQYSEKRLHKLILKYATTPIENIKKKILEDLTQFTNNTFLDDVTFLLLKNK